MADSQNTQPLVRCLQRRRSERLKNTQDKGLNNIDDVITKNLAKHPSREKPVAEGRKRKNGKQFLSEDSNSDADDDIAEATTKPHHKSPIRLNKEFNDQARKEGKPRRRITNVKN